MGSGGNYGGNHLTEKKWFFFIVATTLLTADGMARSSKNALRHGLTSVEAVLDSEPMDEYLEMATSINAALQPQGELEKLLAERISQVSWRLRRVVRTAASIFNDGQQDAEQEQSAFLFSANTRTTVGMGDVFNKVETHKNLITNISKYEAHLERSLYRALHELQRLQLTRSGARILPPIAIDVQFAGGSNE